MRSFLIVKLSSIGDVFQAFPAVDYLSKRFPGCTIDWVCDKPAAELLRAHPRIDRVFVADTKKWRRNPFTKEVGAFTKALRETTYDAIFDLQGNTKSALFTIATRARHKVGTNWSSTPEFLAFLATTVHVPVDASKPTREVILQLLSGYVDGEFKEHDGKVSLQNDVPLPELGARPRIFVATASRWTNKSLREPLLTQFLDRIERELSPSFYFPPEGEEQLSLPHLQKIIEEMDAVIAVDSALLHLAGTTDTPTFSIFGPSTPHIYMPQGKLNAAFQGSCPYNQTFAKRCPKLRTCKTGACLRDIDPDALFNAFLEFWEAAVPLAVH